jgi:hypothetical protein
MHLFHKWSKWSESTVRQRKMYLSGMALPNSDHVVYVQTRHCETCNKEQEREVRP